MSLDVANILSVLGVSTGCPKLEPEFLRAKPPKPERSFSLDSTSTRENGFSTEIPDLEPNEADPKDDAPKVEPPKTLELEGTDDLPSAKGFSSPERLSSNEEFFIRTCKMVSKIDFSRFLMTHR